MAPKKGTKRTVIERTPLDFTSITVADATTETMRSHKPVRGTRDEDQVQVDHLVKKAHAAWVAAGRPSEWAEQPGTYVLLPPDQWETLKWRIQRAGQFYDMKIRFSPVEITEKEYQEGEDGPILIGKFAEVVFTATDKPASTVGTPQVENEN